MRSTARSSSPRWSPPPAPRLRRGCLRARSGSLSGAEAEELGTPQERRHRARHVLLFGGQRRGAATLAHFTADLRDEARVGPRAAAAVAGVLHVRAGAFVRRRVEAHAAAARALRLDVPHPEFHASLAVEAQGQRNGTSARAYRK